MAVGGPHRRHLFGLEGGGAGRGRGGGRTAGVLLEQAGLIQAILPGGGEGRPSRGGGVLGCGEGQERSQVDEREEHGARAEREKALAHLVGDVHHEVVLTLLPVAVL